MNDRLPPSHDYSVRRGEISAYGRAIASAKRLRLLIMIVGIPVVFMLALLWIMLRPSLSMALLMLVSVLLIIIIVGLCLVYRYTKLNFIEPDLAFRMWLQQVCDGELDARIGLDKNHRHYKELNFHTQNLALSLRRLSDDMDSLVESQTNKLSEQKRVLELLFTLTADVSSQVEDKAAFVTVCYYVADWFESATVSCYRVVEGGDGLRCIATRSSDKSDSTLTSFDAIPSNGIEELELDKVPRKITTVEADAHQAVNQIFVPFFAGEQIAGVLIIERAQLQQTEHIETERVLTTVSEQLSLLCGQQLAQDQVLKARLTQDRNELAAEIHDSLAQTLLAMRYQTTLLSEKLKSDGYDDIYEDVLKINGSIEEANEEVRGLIRENRSPLSEHRYAESLQLVIDQFSQGSGIPVFFQSDDPLIRFTPREESALQRIIGEALNNAKKYAKASTIRVYLQRDSSGVRRILVEDDGIGFQQKVVPEDHNVKSIDNGAHIGLTIMQERALNIGAQLFIESEEGEGTRISITMPPLIEHHRDHA